MGSFTAFLTYTLLSVFNLLENLEGPTHCLFWQQDHGFTLPIITQYYYITAITGLLLTKSTQSAATIDTSTDVKRALEESFIRAREICLTCPRKYQSASPVQST